MRPQHEVGGGITDDQPSNLLAANTPPHGAGASRSVALRYTNASASPVSAYLDIWLAGTLESGSYQLETSLVAG